MKFFCWSVACLLSLGLGLPALALPPDPEPLVQLLAEVVRGNPSLQAAREQVNVAAARPDQAAALPDPQLSISLLNYPVDNLATDVTAMTGNDFKLAQMFPFPGKLATRRELARQQQIWAQARYADLGLQIRQQVRDAWYLLGFQQQAIELTQTHLGLMDDLSRLVETRYRVGKGMQQNVLKAQVERSRLVDLLVKLQRDARVTQAKINNLVGRPTTETFDRLPEPIQVDKPLSLADLQQAARRNRPMFQAFDALIAQAEQKNKLANLDYRPDLTVWGSYRFRDNDLPDGGTDFISGGLTINLPFPVAKRRAAVQEAEATQRLAQQQREDFARQVDFELSRSLSDLEQAGKLIELYAGAIIPQVEQAYKATLTAYQVDQVDFLTLADAQMAVYNYKIDYARAQSEFQRSLARIRATSGQDDVSVEMSQASNLKDDAHVQ
jgi:outer membrane protein TolC